ncbi:class I SAM-dependent methyltransferase [bacterium]|nr:class I SAM-dependent methyltransferase [bacterium]
MRLNNTFNYNKLAEYYDKIYFNKDYEKEVRFIQKILEKFNARTVLDVGCGTGEHIFRLEKLGFRCDGLDLSKGMLSIAKQKVKNAQLFLGDMRNFNLGKKYDAIICMFATFNYNLTTKDAIRTLLGFKKHLNDKGIVLLDLHNVFCGGKKEIKNKEIEIRMRWSYNNKKRIERTKAVFKIEDKTIEDTHTFRIFSIPEIKNLFKYAKFQEVIFYKNYTFKKPTLKSKNIEVVGLK